MLSKGIRGAITAEANTKDAIGRATLELISEVVKRNNFQKEDISHVIFTLTEDLNADFPARFARQNFGWDKTAMMCFHELNVPNSLPMCIRILVVINCDETFEPEFVYLKGAANLRK